MMTKVRKDTYLLRPEGGGGGVARWGGGGEEGAQSPTPSNFKDFWHNEVILDIILLSSCCLKVSN